MCFGGFRFWGGGSDTLGGGGHSVEDHYLHEKKVKKWNFTGQYFVGGGGAHFWGGDSPKISLQKALIPLLCTVIILSIV